MECVPSDCPFLRLKSDFALELVDKDFIDMSIHEKNEMFDGYEPLSVVRYEKVDNAVFGRIYFRGVFICDSLENGLYLIDEGVYRLVNTWSSRFKNHLFMIAGVPGRDRLLFHSGNYFYDSKGCVLVGVRNKSVLSHSKITLDRFNTIVADCCISSVKFLNNF